MEKPPFPDKYNILANPVTDRLLGVALALGAFITQRHFTEPKSFIPTPKETPPIPNIHPQDFRTYTVSEEIGFFRGDE